MSGIVEGAALGDVERFTKDTGVRLVARPAALLQLLQVGAELPEGGEVLVADDRAGLLAAVDEHRRLTAETSARDHLAEDVARLGDLVPMHGRTVAHRHSVTADGHDSHSSSLSYQFLSVLS